MKRRLTQIVLVILITLSISLLLAYRDYYDLAEADFPSRNMSFGNSDEENLLIGQQIEFKVFISSAFSLMIHEVINFSKHLPHLTFEAPSFDQKILTLRC